MQLINKTNQFNLTTRRYTEADVLEVMNDTHAFGLQLRLLDRFGDNGIVAIVIGRTDASGDIQLDSWLMSCRVLGRQVEKATLLVVVAESRRLGGKRLIGKFVPTARNAMVRDHYIKLGFSLLDKTPDGAALFSLELDTFVSPEVFISISSE